MEKMCSQVSESSSNIVNNDEREFSKPNNNGRYIQNEGLNRPFKWKRKNLKFQFNISKKNQTLNTNIHKWLWAEEFGETKHRPKKRNIKLSKERMKNNYDEKNNLKETFSKKNLLNRFRFYFAMLKASNLLEINIIHFFHFLALNSDEIVWEFSRFRARKKS